MEVIVNALTNGLYEVVFVEDDGNEFVLIPADTWYSVKQQAESRGYFISEIVGEL